MITKYKSKYRYDSAYGNTADLRLIIYFDTLMKVCFYHFLVPLSYNNQNEL